MDTTVWLLGIFTYLWSYVESVPPAACFANFRWDDCGMPPKAVLYYYKPGSRCEVGFWRGCYPNPNMFKDEYECVNTCIFTVRAQPSDYHNLDNQEVIINDHVIDSDTTNPEDEKTTPGSDKDKGSGGGSGDHEHKKDNGSGDHSSGGGEKVTSDDHTNPGEKPTSPAAPSG